MLISMTNKIKIYIVSTILVFLGIQGGLASENGSNVLQENKILELSRAKWQWMSEKQTEKLDELFHNNSVFVHMGGSMNKPQELGIIKSGGIHYKKADIFNESVQIVGDTAILLGKIRLLAVVGGREVTNPFIVTEVYVNQSGSWKLVSLSFTRLLEDISPDINQQMKHNNL